MLVNRKTGAIEQEQAACEKRATQILENPASPGQVTWAIEVALVGFELMFWQITVLSYTVARWRRSLTGQEQARLEQAESNLAYFEGELRKVRLQQCATYLSEKGASE